MSEPLLNSQTLSYYVGRVFESITEEGDGWAMRLDGDVIIRNKDQARPLPLEDEFEGLIFIRSIFSELDTRLQFGLGDGSVKKEIVLTPTLYSISDPVYVKEGEFYPQLASGRPKEFAPDPSAERVVEQAEEEPVEVAVEEAVSPEKKPRKRSVK